ncbi:DUF7919 family protein [Nannocystis punicea]|uniref:DUF7919 domain-containing protein n=1 Tax=Nannocystis punicea TaxID=2995304 RepID=A0ABY7H6I9_9BACT|nr:hypothetical protein [Nannocystis poenicansa]WAS94883.1 hypothetical protein O0S08_01870 [Nannocystis poenicansa]
MHFPDLSQYFYSSRFTRAGLLNIGWLDEQHPFPVRPPEDALLRALWSPCKEGMARMRGSHRCQFCRPFPSNNSDSVFETFMGETARLGCSEIRVFGADGQAFAAPNLIFHYVRAHHYAPPPSFVEAALHGPQPGTVRYQQILADYL